MPWASIGRTLYCHVAFTIYNERSIYLKVLFDSTTIGANVKERCKPSLNFANVSKLQNSTFVMTSEKIIQEKFETNRKQCEGAVFLKFLLPNGLMLKKRQKDRI